MADRSRIRVLGHVFVWVRLVGAGEGGGEEWTSS